MHSFSQRHCRLEAKFIQTSDCLPALPQRGSPPFCEKTGPCNWFHSVGRDGHFCPNVFPLAAPSGPYQGVTLTHKPRSFGPFPTARPAAPNAPHLLDTAMMRPPVIPDKRTVLHTVRTLQVIP